jgi:hypothetical protein
VFIDNITGRSGGINPFPQPSLGTHHLKLGVIFQWNSTPRRKHLTPEIPEVAPFFPSFGQVVLNMGSRPGG